MAPLADWWRDEKALQKQVEEWGAKLRDIEDREIQEFLKLKADGHAEHHQEAEKIDTNLPKEQVAPVPSVPQVEVEAPRKEAQTDAQVGKEEKPKKDEPPRSEDEKTATAEVGQSQPPEVQLADEKETQEHSEPQVPAGPIEASAGAPGNLPKEVAVEPKEVAVEPKEAPTAGEIGKEDEKTQSEESQVPAKSVEAAPSPTPAPAPVEGSTDEAQPKPGSVEAKSEEKASGEKEEKEGEASKLPLDPEAVRAAAQKAANGLSQLLKKPLEYEVQEALPIYSDPDPNSKEFRTLAQGQHVHGYPGGGWLRLEPEGGVAVGTSWAHIGRSLALTCLLPTIRARYLEAIDVAWPGFGGLLKPGVKVGPLWGFDVEDS